MKRRCSINLHVRGVCKETCNIAENILKTWPKEVCLLVAPTSLQRPLNHYSYTTLIISFVIVMSCSFTALYHYWTCKLKASTPFYGRVSALSCMHHSLERSIRATCDDADKIIAHSRRRRSSSSSSWRTLFTRRQSFALVSDTFLLISAAACPRWIADSGYTIRTSTPF